MIGRLWHGWTKRENADSYEQLVLLEILPGFYRVPGYKGAYFFRNDGPEETEFVALTFFADMNAVRAFAGEDYEAAVVPPESRKLLSRFDQRSKHYETVLTPQLNEQDSESLI